MHVPDRSRFTKAALERWDELGTEWQARLLGNVWCGSCGTMVYIIVESARIEKKDLILSGRCAECGGEVGRLVEGE